MKVDITTRKLPGSTLHACVWAFMLSATVGVSAPPRLSLVKSATLSAGTDSIVVGTASYLLDLRFNTGGNAVSGLQCHIDAAPASNAKYGTTPLTLLGSPFQPSDLVVAPSAGVILGQSGGTTVLFKDSAGDYPAFSDNAIATYQLDTSNLAPGIHVFTPVGGEFTNANTTLTTFAVPGTFALTVLSDGDQDGMPDAFETANNLNPNSSADAPMDDDSDGATNLQEYLAGTNPKNSSSVLRASIQRSGASVQISFTASGNKVYQIEFKNDLLPTTPWVALGRQISRVDDGMLLGSDQISLNIPKRFYRVRVVR